jgi:hypothetical protein
MIIERCYLCGKIKFGCREYSWQPNPGTMSHQQICGVCWPNRPKDFYEVWGIDRQMKSTEAKFVKPIGTPQITMENNNAFGSVLALYDDGTRLGICCEHGGSAWLCLSCAQKIKSKFFNKLIREINTVRF